MPRPHKHRCINARPLSVVYKPTGVPARELEWVTLHLDEFEALRLLDHAGFDQEKTALEMGVSRPTVTRIYASARQKIATALVQGKALCIEGGPVDQMPCPRRPGCGYRHRHGRGNDPSIETGE